MSQRVLYLDPWSGLSGDMTLAALLDLGGPPAEATLHSAVRSLGLEGVTVRVMRDREWGLACTRVEVPNEQAPPLRHLDDMLAVVDRGAVSERVKERAHAALRRLGETEAEVHGCALEEIHFHEVGAADTLVDVVGTFALIEELDVEQVFVGTVPVGGGTVEIAHGRMSVPAPATAALLTGYEVRGGPEMRELTTPTGALLLGQLGAKQGPLPSMTIRGVGYGAGSMRLEGGPDVLRAVLGEAAPSRHVASPAGKRVRDSVVQLETNLDDVSPEVVGHTLRRLREAGALDAWSEPAQMKKDRLGMVLHVLVTPADEEEALEILFAETGTLGIRRAVVDRHIAARGSVSVRIGGREVAVKWGRWGEHVSLAPEHDDAARAAAATGAPLKQVMHEAVEAARLVLEQGERE